jgi:molybdopterin-guanine dinucleotide biosynthesis protein A
MRLQQQVGDVLVNANRNLAAYESFGFPVWPDALPDFAGPLAGFLTGLEQARTPWVATVPCDTPLFPLDLVQRLAAAAVAQDADIAMAVAPEADGQLRTQPVFCLMRRELLDSLARFTHEGGRKIDAWTALHRCAEVAFDAPDDDPRAFFNANTLAELRALERP